MRVFSFSFASPSFGERGRKGEGQGSAERERRGY